MTGPNPLVAEAPKDGDGPGPLTAGNSGYGYAGGINIATSAMDAFNGISSGDWVSGGLGALSFAAEAANAAIDPFGYLLSSAASFLMEHLQPLKDMLDSLAGQPPVIQSYSDTWKNVSKYLGECEKDFAAAVKNGTENWNGQAADAYRASAKEQADAISGAATVADAIGIVVMIMGQVVSFVRDTVRQLIADLVGKLISWVLEEAFSLGFGTPVVVAQAMTAIAKWTDKIGDLLKKLLDTIKKVSPLLGKLAEVFAKVIKIFAKIVGKVTGLDGISLHSIKPGGFIHHGTGGGGDGLHLSGAGHEGSAGEDDLLSSNRTHSEDAPGDDPLGHGSDEDTPGTHGDDDPASDSTSDSTSDPSSASEHDPATAAGDDGAPPLHEGTPDDLSSTATHAGDDVPSHRTPSRPEDVAPPVHDTPSHVDDQAPAPHHTDAPPEHLPADNAPPVHASAPDVPVHHDDLPSSGGSGHETASSAAPPRTSDGTTSSSAPAPPRSEQVPSQRGGGNDGGQQVPPQGGQPSGGGGTPASPGGGTPGRPGAGGGWTGTPGSPGEHVRGGEGAAAPRSRPGADPAPVARGGASGPSAAIIATGPGARPHGAEPGIGRGGEGRGPGAGTGPGRGPGEPKPHENAPKDTTPSSHDHDAAPHPEPEPLSPQEINHQHAENTPAGTSYHRGDPELGDLPQRVKPDPDGRHTVDVHVTPDGHARIGDRHLTPEEFADVLRHNGNYDGGPIRLIGCDAGSNDFAHRLAHELDTDVLAPSKPAWTDSHGRVFSSDYEIGPDGRMRPRIPPDGDWSVHHPDGTSHHAGEDGFTPHTPESHKHDVDADSARHRGEDDNASGEHHHDDSEPQGNAHAGDDVPNAHGFDDVPEPRIIPHDSAEFDEHFVDWNRPHHDEHGHDVYQREPHPGPPVDHGSPQDVEAPHRPRDPEPPGAPPHPEDVSPVPVPLHDHEPLAPHTEYRVRNENGTHTSFFTNDKGEVKWVEADSGGKSMTPHDNKSDGSGFNPDLGYPLLPDVQYHVGNFNSGDNHWTFHTDEHGQTDSMTGDPSYSKSNSEHRDDRNNFPGNSYSAQGRAGHEGDHAYEGHPDHGDEFDHVKWAGGHLAANESGGPGEYINMFPQMAASNSGHARDGWIHEASWRKQEVDLANYGKQPGHDVQNYQVRMTRGADGVPDEVTMRWQEVTYRTDEHGNPVLGADGKPVEESRVTKERVYPNDPSKVNYGPRTPYNK